MEPYFNRNKGLGLAKRAPLVIAFMGACLIGCNGSPESPGAFVPDANSIGANSFPPPKAVLMLEGTNFAVDLKAAMHGSELSIDLISHEKVLETEKYLATKESFSLVEASGLACKPPIELIRYGTNIGGTTQWSGKTVDFGTVIDSTATITSSEDAVVIGEVNYNAVKVEVELFLKASSDSKLSRKLVFWLAKGRGVVKRSFGNSTRAPKP